MLGCDGLGGGLDDGVDGLLAVSVDKFVADFRHVGVNSVVFAFGIEKIDFGCDHRI